MLESAKSEASAADGRATRWEAHKSQRRTDVLDAALSVIEEEGPGVGVQQVADRVGLPRPVVYRHFKGRHDLDEQIRQEIVDRVMAELAPALEPEGTVEQVIRRVVGTYLNWIQAHPRWHHFLGGTADRRPNTGSRVVAGAKTAVAVRVSELLTGVVSTLGQDTAFAESMAFGIVGLVDTTVNRWLGEHGADITSEQLVDFLTTSIWNLLDGYLRSLGVPVAPETRVADLRAG